MVVNKKNGFKAPSLFVQKMLAHKALRHNDGKFFIWDNPSLIDPILNQIHYYLLSSESIGRDNADSLRYYSGKLQSNIGVRIINQRFGYARTIKEKKDLEQFNHGQIALMGFGAIEAIRMDFSEELFIHKGVSSFAEEYKKIFGVSKTPVDYWLCGSYAGALEVTQEKPMFTIETKCVAKGDPYCEFVTKPLDKWDKKDPLVKNNNFLLKQPSSWKKIDKKFIDKLGPFN